MTAHRIVVVNFQQTAERGLPSSAAPILCTCGEVTTSGEWEHHRGQTAAQQRVERNHAAWNERHAAATA